MKNKLGFTLAEILAVIVIVGLLLILVSPLLVNRVGMKESEIKETEESLIISAATLCASDGNSKCTTTKILISDLIEQGYLQENFEDKTSENSKFDDKCVNINNGNYTVGNC